MTKRSNKGKMTKKFRKAASSISGRVHIVPSKSGWSVKKEGSKRASSVNPTKGSAIKKAEKLKSADRIVVHKKDGTIQRYTKKR